jgi:hypothetical protein
MAPAMNLSARNFAPRKDSLLFWKQKESAGPSDKGSYIDQLIKKDHMTT